MLTVTWEAGLDWKKYGIPRASCDPTGPDECEVTAPEEMQKNEHQTNISQHFPLQNKDEKETSKILFVID